MLKIKYFLTKANILLNTYMNKTICIVYAPGSYGSFLSWAIDRCSQCRTQHDPKVIDDPLYENGSSHAYASYCDIVGIDDSIRLFEETREKTNLWGYGIYAGWPANGNVAQLLGRMAAEDRMIYVTRDTIDEILLSWMNSSTKIEQDRWYKMRGISNFSQLFDALTTDVKSQCSTPMIDHRMTNISVTDILTLPPAKLFNVLEEAVGQPMEHEKLFVDVLIRMRSKQHNTFRLDLLKRGRLAELTATEEAVHKFLKGEVNGLN